jgi:maltose alpha-D-glucosyltransferase / alpha-amylase
MTDGLAALARLAQHPLLLGDVEAPEHPRRLGIGAQWAHFLRNHDELDLGRLDESRREVVFSRFGPEPEMQLYHRGIRRRLAPMLGSRAQIELAYSLLFALPGTPVIRYGDEIGMGDDLALPERAAVRTPMQWSSAEGAGFSTAERPVHPLITEGPFGYAYVNVEQQKRDPDSLLNWTRRMIQLRKETPEIGWGSWRALDSGAPQVLAISYEWRGNQVLTVHNLGDQPHEARLSWPGLEGEGLLDILGYEHVLPRADEYRIGIGAFGYRWFRPARVDPVLRQEEPRLAAGHIAAARPLPGERQRRARPPAPKRGGGKTGRGAARARRTRGRSG